MRVIVCGGRGYFDGKLVYAELGRLERDNGERIEVVIQGGANGADALARGWAQQYGRTIVTFEAEWSKYGKSAGPIRNERMLRESVPDLVVAFPGGRGTAHMVAIAKRDNVQCHEVSP